MNQEDAAKLIREKLVEPPGIVDAELIAACEGLIGLDEVGKRVNIKAGGLADKERVVLYLLGMRLLSYLLNAPTCAEVECQTLASELGLEPKTVAAHASVLAREQPRLIRAVKRGSYEVSLPQMKQWLATIKQRPTKKRGWKGGSQ